MEILIRCPYHGYSTPQKFHFILDRNLAKANYTENRVCTSCDTVVLGVCITVYCGGLTYIHTYITVFGVLPLQRHPSPLSGSIWFFIVFSILSLIFFLITVFTNIFFLSYHCFTYIFFFTVLLELIFFTFQHSLGYF